MAYDDRGNFIGDMHWRSDWDFDAGEEIQLERGGIIVQVSEFVGQQTQDLSELVDKRVQEREQRAREKEQRGTSSPASRAPLQTSAHRREAEVRSGQPQIRHKPLTALIGTPTGHHGRAVVPSDSPFAQRRKAGDTATDEDASRPTKRPRYEDKAPSKLGYAQSLFGTALTLSSTPSSSVRLPSQPLPSQSLQRPAPPRIPLSPSPEAANRNVAASASSHGRDKPASRVPLRTLDDRRTNIDGSAATRRPAKDRPAKTSLSPQLERSSKAPNPVKDGPAKTSVPPQTERTSKAPNPKARPGRESPPRDITDLTITISDDDSSISEPAVAEPSRIAKAPQRGLSSPSTLLLDKSIAQKSIPEFPRRSSIEADRLPAQHETKAPEHNPRRTELRLKSRKKRGLLVVSEEARAKQVRDLGDELLNEIPSSILGKSHRMTARQNVDSSLLDACPTEKNNAESSEPSFFHPDTSLAPPSGQSREEQQVDPGKRADKTLSKSKKRTKRGDAVNVAQLVEEPVEELQPERETKMRSKRASAQHHDPVQGDTNTKEQGPRLVKLSRKSVKSKELLGFVFDDADARTGNGSFSIHPLNQSRARDPNLYAPIPVSKQAAIQAPRTVIGGDEEPGDFLDHDSEDAASKPLGPNSIRSVPCRSQSPLPQMSPTSQMSPFNSESLASCAPLTIEDKHIDMEPPAESRDRKASRHATNDPSTVPARVIREEKPMTRNPPVGQCQGQKLAVEATAMEADVQLRTAPPEPPKLANPATRGRKAALKSHAAGQVPRPVLPADIGMQAAPVARREPSKDTGAGLMVPGNIKAVPKIKMTFPGFVSAKGGGPWSREAHDLLETGRPD